MPSVMGLIREQGRVNNAMVAARLSVSGTTAERYFDELEVQDKITQVGQTGQSVYYQAK